MHYLFLDIYRYLAALIVSVSHFFIYWNKSDFFEFTSILGVELFFVLSGFVLASQLLKLEASPKKNLKIFLFRPWIRTVPPYLVALICAAIVFDYGDKINFLKFLTYTQNILSDNSEPNFFNVAWSLSVEEWFYIFLPLAILIGSKFKFNNFRLDTVTICFIIIVFLNLFRIYYNDENINWGEDIRRSVLMRLDSLCFGVVAFIIKDKINFKYLYFFLFLTIIPLFYFLTKPLLLSNSLLFQNLFIPLCSICFSSILIILTKKKSDSKLLKRFSSGGANISYAMYLFHIFFIPITVNLFDNIVLSLISYLLFLKLFCLLFFYLFEKPLLDSRPNYI